MTEDNTSRIAQQLLRATLAHFDSQRQTALATLDLYLHRPAAIGDHPTVVEEVIKATKALAEAEKAMDAVERNFLRNQQEVDLTSTEVPGDIEE